MRRDGLPEPEDDDLGRYLEDTITIDWQTPRVTEKARELLTGAEDAPARVERLFRFVRDEIAHSLDIETSAHPCRASEVLAAGTGLCYAKSHLLAALLRFAGIPTGFCYARVLEDERSGRFVLHGFNALYWQPTGRWIPLDARGNTASIRTECRFAPPWRLSVSPDPDRGEAFLPFVYRRPARRIIDLLERAPSLEAIQRHLPDSL